MQGRIYIQRFFAPYSSFGALLDYIKFLKNFTPFGLKISKKRLFWPKVNKKNKFHVSFAQNSGVTNSKVELGSALSHFPRYQ